MPTVRRVQPSNCYALTLQSVCVCFFSSSRYVVRVLLWFRHGPVRVCCFCLKDSRAPHARRRFMLTHPENRVPRPENPCTSRILWHNNRWRFTVQDTYHPTPGFGCQSQRGSVTLPGHISAITRRNNFHLKFRYLVHTSSIYFCLAVGKIHTPPPAVWCFPPPTVQVLAARAGVVVAFCDHFGEGGVRESLRPRANFVALRHCDGTYTRYVHLMRRGILVKLGQVIGEEISPAGCCCCCCGFRRVMRLSRRMLRLRGSFGPVLPQFGRHASKRAANTKRSDDLF